MKNDGLTSILLGVLAVSALASLVLFAVQIKYNRQYAALQQRVAAVNVRQAAIRQLISDVAEYAKTTKDKKEILDILESVGLKAVISEPGNPPQGVGAVNPK